jgi:hypothetical protein
VSPRSQTLHTSTGWLLKLALVLLVVACPRRALAQPFELRETGWEGAKGLVDLARHELGDGRVIASGKLDWHAIQPTDGILVLHPEVVADGDELAAFLRAGGRAAILDDFGVGDRILRRYEIKRVPAPAAPLYALRGNPNLALAEPVSETVAGRKGGVHPVVAEVGRLVTNHPTGLLHPDLSTVLRIRASGEADVALAVAGQVGKGRLFAMGDPSAVINLMLRYPGNRAFASGLVRYLVDDDTWGARQGKLYIVSNRFEEVGVYGADSSNLRELRERLRSLRAEIQKIGGDGLPREVSFGLAVACAAGLLFWSLSIAARPYRHPQPRFARGAPLLAQGGAAGRAAVLVAETTHRGLILLEQKDALEEEIGLLLGMDTPPTMMIAIEEIQRRGLLDPTRLAALRAVFFEMGSAETAVTTGTPLRITQKQLLRAESVGRDVCEAIAERLRQGSAQGPMQSAVQSAMQGPAKGDA